LYDSNQPFGAAINASFELPASSWVLFFFAVFSWLYRTHIKTSVLPVSFLKIFKNMIAVASALRQLLVSSTPDAVLGADELAQFKRDGFLVIRGLLDEATLASLRPRKLDSVDRASLSADKELQKAVVLGNPETDEDPNTVIKLEGLRRYASTAAGPLESPSSGGEDLSSRHTGRALGGVDLDGLSHLCEHPALASISRQLLGERCAKRHSLPKISHSTAQKLNHRWLP
jgi:hypothetical protein